MKQNIRFISLEEIINIHNDQISIFGGVSGLRQNNLLESAIESVKTTFYKKYLYKNIVEMGAAYAFHIIKNHPFVDGNKRTGMIAMLLFLKHNGYRSLFTNKELYSLGIEIASSKLDVNQIAKTLEKSLIKI